MLSFADKDAGALWNELKLSQLVSDNPDPEDILPLALQSHLGMRRSKEKLLLEHTKQWKKPSYNVLKDRYASKPHEPPVLDASKLKTLADPLRGKYASYDKLMSEDEDDDGEERSKRLGNTGRPHRYNNSGNEYSGTPSSAAKKGSPSRVGSSAFFLTAAGSDDEATDDYYANRIAQPKVSKFRGKLEEAKRGGRGGLRDVLSKPLLEQKKRQTTQPPGLSRKKSGKIPTAAELLQQQQRTKKKSSAFSFTHIKSSIPPQQPLPKRRPPTKIFSVGPTKTMQPSGKAGSVRRGAAPVDQALGVGLDLSNVSSNGGAGVSALEARRAARLARVAAGGRVGGSGARGGAVQSKDTSDALPPKSASGGGANAAARIRAARGGGGFVGPSGAKSAPQLATVEETTLRRNGKIAPLASLGAGGGPGAVGARPRKKSVSIIDPSLSPLEKKKGVAAATSPRSKQPPASPRAAAAPSQPVDMNALRSTLAKIQANEAERSGVKDTDQSLSAAAILAQHAKRISSQFQKANELSSKFLSVDADDERPIDMSAFMPKRKVVI